MTVFFIKNFALAKMNFVQTFWKMKLKIKLNITHANVDKFSKSLNDKWNKF